MFNKISNIDFKNKTVLIRCDFNVPLNDNGEITNNKRIRASLKTIKHVYKDADKLILFSHLGRPKGEYNNKFSMKPVAKELERLLNNKVVLLEDENVISQDVKEQIEKAESKSIFLLENTRFRKEEKKNDKSFAKEMASLGDVFVSDAFGVAHRAHASNVGITEYLDSTFGFLMENEIDVLSKVIKSPEKPLIAILGGAKVSDKIGVIDNLLSKVDAILIGGGMAFTFLKAQGYEIGKSLFEEDKIDIANELLKKAEEKKVKFILPLDVVCAKEFSNEAEAHIKELDLIEKDEMGLDIGPKSVKIFKDVLEKSKTVVWNGPMGVFEFDKFANGTIEIAKALADSNAYSVVGGGDSVSAIEKFGLEDKINHISTGGGASLELLEGKKLPGIVAIKTEE